MRDVARITHHNEEAYVGALAIALAVRIAWTDRWPQSDDLISMLIPLLPDSRVRETLEDMAGVDSTLPLLEVASRYGTSGYVAESVPMAMWAAQRVWTLGFESMIREIIRCGGDTDTIASMAGQIAGTLVGTEGLPRLLLQRLPDREAILNVAERLAAMVTVL